MVITMKMEHIETHEHVGLIVVYTGDGTGKTTAALGIALRAAGHRSRVCIIRFVKDDLYSGEIDGLKMLSPYVEQHLAGKEFGCTRGDPYPYNERRANAQCSIDLAREKIASGLFEIVILDEINSALQLGLVDLPQVVELLDKKPPKLHLVLTGRDAPVEVCSRAHTVTEMREVKHAGHQGIEAQAGIDY